MLLTLCSLWDVCHLKLPTTWLINGQMQPIPSHPTAVSKVTNKDTDMGCTHWKDRHKNAAAFPLFFNTLDCILRNATKTKSVLTKAVAKKEKGRIKRRWWSTCLQWLRRATEPSWSSTTPTAVRPPPFSGDHWKWEQHLISTIRILSLLCACKHFIN